ncbi:MAG: Hsp20/alpha crystallin family protein [bacterium]
MNLVRWTPFGEFDHLVRALEQPRAPVRRADWLPLVDIRESAESYHIDVEVPAVASEDLAVTVSEGVLNVSGERRSSGSDGDSRTHRTERRYGRFERSFSLPDDADPDAITAESRDGVLYLSIAKRAPAIAKKIEVKIS